MSITTHASSHRSEEIGAGARLELAAGVGTEAGGVRRGAFARGQVQPDLTTAPACDQLFLSRALHFDPSQRYPSCSAFVTALAQSGRSSLTSSRSSFDSRPGVVAVGANGQTAAATTGKPLPSPEQVISGLVQRAAGSLTQREYQNVRFFHRAGQYVEYSCCTTIFEAAAINGMRCY